MRRTVIGFGVAAMTFGVWLLFQVHSRVGGCSVSTSTGASPSALDSSCARTLLSYGEGFVFVAAGVLIAVIAARMIAQRERRDLRGALRSVPRTWKTPLMVLTSSSSDRVEGRALHHSVSAD